MSTPVVKKKIKKVESPVVEIKKKKEPKLEEVPPPVVVAVVPDAIQVEVSAAALFSAAYPESVAFKYMSITHIAQYDACTALSDKLECVVVMATLLLV